VTIRKQIENFQNQEYLMKKKELVNNNDNNKKGTSNPTPNRQLKKIDFGSDFT